MGSDVLASSCSKCKRRDGETDIVVNTAKESIKRKEIEHVSWSVLMLEHSYVLGSLNDLRLTTIILLLPVSHGTSGSCSSELRWGTIIIYY